MFILNKIKEKNKDYVLKAVENDGMVLKYASSKLQNDKDVALAAVSQNSWALEYVSPELQNDEDIIKATEYDEDEEYDEDKYLDTCDPDYLDI